jgi:hypothetical protein
MRRSTLILLLISVLTACAQQRSPATVIETWADAAKAGDYATAEALMTGDDFAKMTWREPHIRYHKAGRLEQYTMIDGPTATGQSHTATLRWTGSMAPLCITVQVGADGLLTPLSDYARCEVTP